VKFSEGTGQAVLNQIIRRGDIACERARIPAQARDLGFDAPMNVGHEFLSRKTRSVGGRSKLGASLPAGCNPMMSAALVLCKEL
jgi:hypothetical protein